MHFFANWYHYKSAVYFVWKTKEKKLSFRVQFLKLFYFPPYYPARKVKYLIVSYFIESFKPSAFSVQHSCIDSKRFVMEILSKGIFMRGMKCCSFWLESLDLWSISKRIFNENRRMRFQNLSLVVRFSRIFVL